MYLLSLLWIVGSTGVVAQSEIPLSQPQVQGQSERQSAPQPPSTPVENQFKAWLHRTGSGLFISLTPFVTAVALALLLLIILVPIVIEASRRRSRGYFKTIPHGR